MNTFNRICIKDYFTKGSNGDFEIRRGKEYLTTKEEDGKVTVLSNFWVSVPVELFAGEIQFTKE